MDRADLKGQTILLMEEEVLIALDLRAVLERAGARVYVVRYASEALACLRKFNVTAAAIVGGLGRKKTTCGSGAEAKAGALSLLCDTSTGGRDHRARRAGLTWPSGGIERRWRYCRRRPR